MSFDFGEKQWLDGMKWIMREKSGSDDRTEETFEVEIRNTRSHPFRDQSHKKHEKFLNFPHSHAPSIPLLIHSRWIRVQVR
jgi:hypothetical protein